MNKLFKTLANITCCLFLLVFSVQQSYGQCTGLTSITNNGVGTPVLSVDPCGSDCADPDCAPVVTYTLTFRLTTPETAVGDVTYTIGAAGSISGAGTYNNGEEINITYDINTDYNITVAYASGGGAACPSFGPIIPGFTNGALCFPSVPTGYPTPNLATTPTLVCEATGFGAVNVTNSGDNGSDPASSMWSVIGSDENCDGTFNTTCGSLTSGDGSNTGTFDFSGCDAGTVVRVQYCEQGEPTLDPDMSCVSPSVAITQIAGPCFVCVTYDIELQDDPEVDTSVEPFLTTASPCSNTAQLAIDFVAAPDPDDCASINDGMAVEYTWAATSSTYAVAACVPAGALDVGFGLNGVSDQILPYTVVDETADNFTTIFNVVAVNEDCADTNDTDANFSVKVCATPELEDNTTDFVTCSADGTDFELMVASSLTGGNCFDATEFRVLARTNTALVTGGTYPGTFAANTELAAGFTFMETLTNTTLIQQAVTYTIEARNADADCQDCTATINIDIIVDPVVTIASTAGLTGDGLYCPGEAVQVSVETLPIGGTVSYAFNVDLNDNGVFTDAGESGTNGATGVATDDMAGTFEIDETLLDNAAVNQTGSRLDGQIVITTDNGACDGDETTLDFEICPEPRVVICAGPIAAVTPVVELTDDIDGDQLSDEDECVFSICSGEPYSVQVRSNLQDDVTRYVRSITGNPNTNIATVAFTEFTAAPGAQLSVFLTGPVINFTTVSQDLAYSLTAVNDDCNDCEGEPVLFNITVEPNVDVDAPGDDTYCSNDGAQSSGPFMGTPTGGVSQGIDVDYTIDAADAGFLGITAMGTIVDGATLNYTIPDGVTAQRTITVTLTFPDDCDMTDTTFDIIINPEPVLDPIADIRACSGEDLADISLTLTNTDGGADDGMGLDVFTYDIAVVDGCSGQPIPAITVLSTETIVPTFGNIPGPAGFGFLGDATTLAAPSVTSGTVQICVSGVADLGNVNETTELDIDDLGLDDVVTLGGNGFGGNAPAGPECFTFTPAQYAIVSADGMLDLSLDSDQDIDSGISFTYTLQVINDLPAAIASMADNGDNSIADFILGSIYNTTAISQSLTYTITPTGDNGCVGDPITFDVIVDPEPVYNDGVVADAVCEGATLNINLNNGTATGLNPVFHDGISILANDFSWTATTPSGNVAGFTPSQDFGVPTTVIADQLFLTSGATGTVEYIVTPRALSADCSTSATAAMPCVGEPFTVTVTLEEADFSTPDILSPFGPYCQSDACVDLLDESQVDLVTITAGLGTDVNFRWLINDELFIPGPPAAGAVVNGPCDNEDALGGYDLGATGATFCPNVAGAGTYIVCLEFFEDVNGDAVPDDGGCVTRDCVEFIVYPEFDTTPVCPTPVCGSATDVVLMPMTTPDFTCDVTWALNPATPMSTVLDPQGLVIELDAYAYWTGPGVTDIANTATATFDAAAALTMLFGPGFTAADLTAPIAVTVEYHVGYDQCRLSQTCDIVIEPTLQADLVEDELYLNCTVSYSTLDLVNPFGGSPQVQSQFSGADFDLSTLYSPTTTIGGVWTITAQPNPPGGFDGQGADIVGTTLFYAEPGCYTLQYSVGGGTCPADVETVEILVSEDPIPSFDLPDNVCWDGVANTVVYDIEADYYNVLLGYTPGTRVYTTSDASVATVENDGLFFGNPNRGNVTIVGSGTAEICIIEVKGSECGFAFGPDAECSTTVCEIINVTTTNTDIDPSWSNPGPLCVDATAVDLDALVTTEGGDANGVFTGEGVTGTHPDYLFTPATAGVGIHNVCYTVGATAGCDLTECYNIIVLPHVPADLLVDNFSICLEPDELITLNSIVLPGIPEILATAGLGSVSLATTGDLVGSAIGPDVIKYEGGCGDLTVTVETTDCDGATITDEVIISISQKLQGSFSIPDDLCQDEGNFSINNGVTQAYGCSSTLIEFDVIGGPAAQVNLDALIGGAPVTGLTINAAGNVVGLPVVIDPGAVAQGRYRIRMTMTDANGICDPFIFEQEISIHRDGDPSWTTTSPVCTTDATAFTTTLSLTTTTDVAGFTLPAADVQWYGEGVVDGPGIDGTFTANMGAGTYTVCVTVGDARCEETECHDIVVAEEQVAVLADLGVECSISSSGTVALSDLFTSISQSAEGGTWAVVGAGASIVANTLNYTTAGCYTVTYTLPAIDPATCVGAANDLTASVHVTQQPQPSFDMQESYCWDGAAGQTLSTLVNSPVYMYNDAIQTPTISWTSTDAAVATVDANNGTVTIIGAGTVNICLQELFESSCGSFDDIVCSATFCHPLTITLTSASVDPSWTTFGPICENSDPVDLDALVTAAGGDANGVFTGTGVTGTHPNYDFTTADLGGQTVNICYTVGNGAGCDAVECYNIVVEDAATATLVATTADICPSASAGIDLTQFFTTNTTTGGTFTIPVTTGFAAAGDILTYDPNMDLPATIVVTYTVGNSASCDTPANPNGAAPCTDATDLDCYAVSTIEITISNSYELALDVPEFCITDPSTTLGFENYLSILDSNGDVVDPATFTEGDDVWSIVAFNGSTTTTDAGTIDADTGDYTPGAGSGFVTIRYTYTEGNSGTPGIACIEYVEDVFELRQPVTLEVTADGCHCDDDNGRTVDLQAIGGGLAPYTLNVTGGALLNTYDGTATTATIVLADGNVVWSATIVDARGCEISINGACDAFTEPPVLTGVQNAVCATDPDFNISASNISGAGTNPNNQNGAFTVSPVNNNIFTDNGNGSLTVSPDYVIANPAFAQLYTITYTYGSADDTADNCMENTVTTQFTIYPSFDATFALPAPVLDGAICESAAPITLSADPDFEGSPLFGEDLADIAVWTVTDGSGNSYVTGTAASGPFTAIAADGSTTFNPDFFEPGTYTITHRIGFDACQTESSATITIKSQVDASLLAAQSYCASISQNISLSALYTNTTTPGGTFTIVSATDLAGADVSGTDVFIAAAGANQILQYNENGDLPYTIRVQYAVGDLDCAVTANPTTDADCYVTNEMTFTITGGHSVFMDLPEASNCSMDAVCGTGTKIELFDYTSIEDVDLNTLTVGTDVTFSVVAVDGSTTNLQVDGNGDGDFDDAVDFDYTTLIDMTGCGSPATYADGCPVLNLQNVPKAVTLTIRMTYDDGGCIAIAEDNIMVVPTGCGTLQPPVAATFCSTTATINLVDETFVPGTTVICGSFVVNCYGMPDLDPNDSNGNGVFDVADVNYPNWTIPAGLNPEKLYISYTSGSDTCGEDTGTTTIEICNTPVAFADVTYDVGCTEGTLLNLNTIAVTDGVDGVWYTGPFTPTVPTTAAEVMTGTVIADVTTIDPLTLSTGDSFAYLVESGALCPCPDAIGIVTIGTITDGVGTETCHFFGDGVAYDGFTNFELGAEYCSDDADLIVQNMRRVCPETISVATVDGDNCDANTAFISSVYDIDGDAETDVYVSNSTTLIVAPGMTIYPNATINDNWFIQLIYFNQTDGDPGDFFNGIDYSTTDCQSDPIDDPDDLDGGDHSGFIFSATGLPYGDGGAPDASADYIVLNNVCPTDDVANVTGVSPALFQAGMMPGGGSYNPFIAPDSLVGGAIDCSNPVSPGTNDYFILQFSAQDIYAMYDDGNDDNGDAKKDFLKAFFGDNCNGTPSQFTWDFGAMTFPENTDLHMVLSGMEIYNYKENVFAYNNTDCGIMPTPADLGFTIDMTCDGQPNADNLPDWVTVENIFDVTVFPGSNPGLNDCYDVTADLSQLIQPDCDDACYTFEICHEIQKCVEGCDGDGSYIYCRKVSIDKKPNLVAEVPVDDYFKLGCAAEKPSAAIADIVAAFGFTTDICNPDCNPDCAASCSAGCFANGNFSIPAPFDDYVINDGTDIAVLPGIFEGLGVTTKTMQIPFDYTVSSSCKTCEDETVTRNLTVTQAPEIMLDIADSPGVCPEEPTVIPVGADCEWPNCVFGITLTNATTQIILGNDATNLNPQMICDDQNLATDPNQVTGVTLENGELIIDWDELSLNEELFGFFTLEVSVYCGTQEFNCSDSDSQEIFFLGEAASEIVNATACTNDAFDLSGMFESNETSPGGVWEYNVDPAATLTSTGWMPIAGDEVGGTAVTKLDAGTYAIRYTVGATTSCAESSVAQLIISEISISFTGVTNADCESNETGSATAEASGGVAPYDFAWSNGATTAEATDLHAGGYAVTVTDANGCSEVGAVSITDPDGLNLAVTIETDPACNGDDGTATVLASGGTPGYTYTWSNSATGATQALEAGFYTVTVTDANDCIAVQHIEIEEPALFTAVVENVTDITCNGLTDGIVQLDATGGTAPYTFTFDAGSALMVGSISGNMATGLDNGTYTFLATDINGCTSTVTATVDEPLAIDASVNLQANVSCFGGDDGQIYLTVTGGTAPYSYQWTGFPDAGGSQLPDDVQEHNDVQAGTYAVEITDSNGCSFSIVDIVITEPNELIASAVNDQDALCESNEDGGATASAIGGTGAYTFEWSTGATTAIVTDLHAGGYTVTVTDANGCTDVAAVQIDDPTSVVATITSITDVDCNGEATGSATVVGSGGTGDYTYSWSSDPVQTTDVASDLPAGTYTVTITDVNGCISIATATIDEPTLLIIDFVLTEDASCLDADDGSLIVEASGGTTGYMYTITDGVTTVGPQTSAEFTDLAPGDYTITVTDDNDCTAMTTATIGEPDALEIADTNGVSPTSCNGGNDGSIYITVSGGTAPYDYNWEGDGVGGFIPGDDIEDQTALPAGDYNVTVTDLNGCTATDSWTVTEPTEVVGNVDSVVAASCISDEDGTATVSASGGTGSYDFLWSSGLEEMNVTTSTSEVLHAGGYSVTIVDGNGCEDIVSFSITDPDDVTVVITAETDALCNGDNGSVTAVANGGVGPYNFDWSDGTDNDLTNVPGPDATSIASLPAGTYTVLVTDANGCDAVATVEVEQPDIILAELIGNTDETCNEANDGTATVNATGGLLPYTYTWSNGDGTATANDLEAGVTYSVTVTDNNDCIAVINNITVDQPEVLEVTLDSSTNPVCVGGDNGSIFVTVSGGSAPYGFDWSMGQDVEDPTNLIAGTYNVLVTDVNGCTAVLDADVVLEDVDTEDPTFVNCPDPGFMLDVFTNDCVGAANWDIPVATDNCEVTVTVDNDNNSNHPTTGLEIMPGDLLPPGTYTVAYIATDGFSNTDSCSFSINVEDTETPVLTCPTQSAITVKGTNTDCTFVMGSNDFDATFVENCTSLASLTHNYTSGSSAAINTLNGHTFPLGNTNVIWTAVDSTGNSATCSFVITVEDDDAPTFECPTAMNIDGCAGTVTDLVSGLVGEDNCSNVTFSQNPVAGSLFGPNSGDTVDVTITASDEAGNETECTVTLTIIDEEMPVFLDCPLQTITVGTDTDQCRAYVNWETPVVYDNCDQPLTPVQMSGPTNGTTLDLGTYTVVYVATDADGNTAECSFMIEVVDTQYPWLMAGIPVDVTLNCEEAATFEPFVMTSLHVMDNCTDPVTDIDNVYVSGQGSDPSMCDFYTYSDLYTWMATDSTGNSSTWKQVVSYEDVTAPILTLPLDATVECGDDSTPDATGSATAVDNCAAEDNISLVFVDVFTPSCGLAGTIVRTWTATDPCGNTSSADQTILVEDTTAPELVCMDITVDLDENGEITISATDVITSVSDVCSDDADLTFAMSQTQFTCDNIGVNEVMLVVTDPCGNEAACNMNVTIEDNLAPTIVCPDNIAIALEPGGCDASILSVAEANDNCSAVVTYSPNILLETLPIGITTVTATATDESGNSSECTFDVEVIEFVPTSSDIACNNHINLSLGTDCSAVILADMILEGNNYGCYDDYCVEITTENGQPHNNFFDLSDVNQTFTVSITDCQGTGNSCWGTVLIEEKLLPEIECPADVTITCNVDPEARDLVTNELLTGELMVLSCEPGGDARYEDQFVDNGACNSPRAHVLRTWTFEDAQGNEVSCLQTITVSGFVLDDVVFPEDFDILNPFECSDVNEWPLLTTPEGYPFDPAVPSTWTDGTGFPMVNGVPVQNTGNLCGVSVNMSDEIFDICDGSYEILRTWKVRNMCGPVTPTNPLIHTQVIKVLDSQGPNLGICPDDLVVSTDPWGCEAGLNLPLPDKFHDLCSSSSFDANIYGGGFLDIEGTIAGNDLVVYAGGMDKGGSHLVVYSVSDACGNITTCEINIDVVDQTPPVVLATQNIVISLTSGSTSENGLAKLYAESVDNGSYDGCSDDVKLEVRRELDNCNVKGNTTYNADGHSDDGSPNPNSPSYDPDGGAYVKFCCDDLTSATVDVNGDGVNDAGYHKVWLRVWDDGDMNGVYGSDGDNFTEAWAFVKVEDKLAPAIQCPADVTLTCDMDYTDLGLTGEATAFSSCGGIDVEYNDIIINLNTCNEGFVRRRWNVVGRSDIFCDQTITVDDLNNADPTVSFSQVGDFTAAGCPDQISVGEPTWLAGPCDVLGYTVETDTFKFEDGACYKLVNTYTVINWCDYEPNNPFWDGSGIWEHTQVIKVTDETKPVIADCEDKMFAINDHSDSDDDGIICEAKITLTNSAMDEGSANCPTGWLKWQVIVDLWGDGTPDLEYSSFLPAFDSQFNDTNGNGIGDVYVSPTANGETISIPLPDIAGSMSNHKVSWKVTDGCNNVTTCNSDFMVVDKKAPTPYCIDISSAVMENDGTVELWSIDFNLGSYDNCSAQEALRYTFTDVAPEDDSSYDPTQRSSAKTFDCDDVANSPVEVSMYVWDEKGNSDFCSVYLTLVDNTGVCGEGKMIAGNISTESGNGVNEVEATLSAALPEYPRTDMTDAAGDFAIDNAPLNANYQITASKDVDYLNGVSTLDLVKIQRHILGLEDLDSPYKLIAADINADNKIKASDLAQLRKLILGVIVDLPTNESWRFVNGTQDLDMDLDLENVDYMIEIDNLQSDMMDNNMVAVKVGDVTENATVNVQGSENIEVRSAKTLELMIDNRAVKAGDKVEVDFTSSDFKDVYGYQFTMELNGLEMADVVSGAIEMTEANVGMLTNDVVTVSYHNGTAKTATANESVFTMVFTATEDGQLSEMIEVTSKVTSAEAYLGNAFEIRELVISTRGDITASADNNLYQNEPNPFKDQTIIKFELAEEGAVTFTVTDVAGKLLKTVNTAGVKGMNILPLGADDLGTTGVLYYTIKSGEFTATKKMIIVR